MVNNFDKIRNFLTFNSSDDFYFIQILKRRKDNPTLFKNILEDEYQKLYYVRKKLT